jgi:hypothetical protein
VKPCLPKDRLKPETFTNHCNCFAMKLFSYCSSCKKEIPVKSLTASTRSDLAMDKGEQFYLQCPNCAVQTKVHVNDVRAKASNWMAIGGLVISLIFTIFLWKYLSAISTITILIPLIIFWQQSNSVNAFNRLVLRRNK